MKAKIALIGLALTIGFSANAQIINPKESTKGKVEDRTNRKADETIDKGLDKIEEGIGNIFKKKDKKEKKGKGDKKETTQQNGNSKDTQNGQPVTTTDQQENTDYSAYKNFDFIAGKKVIFFDDFSSGLSKWKVIEHDLYDDVMPHGIKSITNSDASWFKTPRKGVFFPESVKSLSDEFTIEFDMWADVESMSANEGGLSLIFVTNNVNREEFSIHFDENPQIQLDIHPSEEHLYCIAVKENGDDERTLDKKEIKNGWTVGKPHRISISRNKTHIKLYINEKKYIDLPNGLPKKGNYTLVLATNMWGDGLYFTNFKLAEGISNPTKLDNDGKFVTSAIYFNTNSSKIKPESWSALNQAATVIKSSQGKISIVGHTDSDGNDESNLQLSQKRAEAVKQALVKNFGIDPSRLVTDGKGESEPVDNNNTSEGKANNRRVEFIQQ